MTATTDFIKSSVKEQTTTNLPKGAIKDFLWTKDKSLTQEFCKNIIEKFNDDERKKAGVVGRLKEIKSMISESAIKKGGY